MVLSMISARMAIQKSATASTAAEGMESSAEAPDHKSFVIVGTAYALPDEDEPTKGRVIIFSCEDEDEETGGRKVRKVTELQVRGGVYSICQFYDGKILTTVNSKTQMCHLVDEGTGTLKLTTIGVGHHGHILSLFVSSRANKAVPVASGADEAMASGAPDGEKKAKAKQQLAIVGDLMRSISLVQHYPEHNTLEEVARDFNANWTTAVSMLTDDVYIGGENWNNIFVLKRNTKATSEEIRCRLDTVGEFHLGEMVNKFMSGSLVMPMSQESSSSSGSSSRNRRSLLTSPKKGDGSGKMSTTSPKGTSASASRSKRPVVAIGSQTLFGTTEGTLGSILGLDAPSTAFFSCMERAMQKVVKPVGNFSHARFRAFNAEQRQHPSHGFVDGDLVESFLDLDKTTMDEVVREMNRDGSWEADDVPFAAGESDAVMEDNSRPELVIDDVVALVEEMTMLH